MRPLRVYLACPYKHTDRKIRAARVEIAERCKAALMLKGYVVYNPLADADIILKHIPEEHHYSWSFWKDHCLPFVSWSNGLVQIMLPDDLGGWKTSRGCKAERLYAYEIGLPVTFMRPEEIIKQERISPAIRKGGGDRLFI